MISDTEREIAAGTKLALAMLSNFIQASEDIRIQKEEAREPTAEEKTRWQKATADKAALAAAS